MRATYTLTALTALTAGLLLTGCVDNSAAESPTGGTGSTDGETISVEKNEELAAMLPEDIKAAGVLNVGMANNYPPERVQKSGGGSRRLVRGPD